MRLSLLVTVVLVASWPEVAAAEEVAPRPSFLPGVALLPTCDPGLRLAPRPIPSTQWVLAGDFGIDEHKVAGLEVDLEVERIDWLSVLTRVGVANRTEAGTAARLVSPRGRVGADLGASVTAQAGSMVPAAELEVWGSLDASAWLAMTEAWQLSAFVGAAEPLNADDASAPERRVVGGFFVKRAL